jgi:23S rRNA U2552 (ribose-2'-O)-methylase RlmE/FtsJ
MPAPYRSASAQKLSWIAARSGLLSAKSLSGAAVVTPCVVDLAAAPGGFSQVAVELLQQNGAVQRPFVVAVDQRHIEPLPHVSVVRGSIATHRTLHAVLAKVDTVNRAQLTSSKTLGRRPFAPMVVLHDGVGIVDRVSPLFAQTNLALCALRCASQLMASPFDEPRGCLAPPGTPRAAGEAVKAAYAAECVFVTKLLRSVYYNSAVDALGAHFEHIDTFVPPASRGSTTEGYVVARGLRPCLLPGGDAVARRAARRLLSVAPREGDALTGAVWQCSGCFRRVVGTARCSVCDDA